MQRILFVWPLLHGRQQWW